jgi:hypothetical protein
VLVLSQHVEFGLAMKLLPDSAEGVGYLLEDRIGDVPEFLAAVRRVGCGGSALDPTIISTMLARRRRDNPARAAHPRERQVLGLMAMGSCNQGIADAMVITLRAVEFSPSCSSFAPDVRPGRSGPAYQKPVPCSDRSAPCRPHTPRWDVGCDQSD